MLNETNTGKILTNIENLLFDSIAFFIRFVNILCGNFCVFNIFVKKTEANKVWLAATSDFVKNMDFGCGLRENPRLGNCRKIFCGDLNSVLVCFDSK